MVFRAAIRRPLRSKRAMTSPVRARSKASGFTRIRVRLTALWLLCECCLRFIGGTARRVLRDKASGLLGERVLVRLRPGGLAADRRCRRPAHGRRLGTVTFPWLPPAAGFAALGRALAATLALGQD